MTDLSDIRSAVAAAAHGFADGLPRDLLADLRSTGPNQQTRIVRLHTPLGADVLLAERVRISEGIGPRPSGPVFAIDLLALSTDAALQPDGLIGQPVLLELLTAHSRTELRPFHGHVLAFELLGADGGYARYRLRIGTWLDFLRHRTDSWMFQDLSVVEITESIFADYAGQGALQPWWRWNLEDPAVYPRLSTLSQHAETDFDFLQRLWSANGLFCWFEHEGQPQDKGALGRHTLVIADHNGALGPNEQGRIRFTQPGATMKEDSITRWQAVRRLGVTALNTASFDYRAVGNHAASTEADAAHDQPMPLVHTDQPGAYTFETPAEAQRVATVLQQSLDAQRKQFEGRSTVRTLAPATTFVLSGHAEHDADLLAAAGEDAARFVLLSVVHKARNNLSADAMAGLQQLPGHALWQEHETASGRDHALRPHRHAARTADPHTPALAPGNDSAEPLYEASLVAQRAATAVRAPIVDARGALLHPKPTAWGTQTAIVVGLNDPIHTDRDGRIKVQFHWQRGAQASHRQAHPAGEDNAPASDASGTWVRVAQPWAGANWGGLFIPRLGQEVIVAFLEGDIDRPVVIGAVYNGAGTQDGQGNDVASGAATATGNAPAWFPGSARQGAHEGHAHAATLSGFKSQALDTSQTGVGGHNQLVFDDTPGQGRVLVHTTQHQTWLQLGHLLQQNDNQRLAQRGHGLELHTQAQGALRAGKGLHVSTHGRAGGTSTAQGQPIDAKEALEQLANHAEMLEQFGANARTHLATLPNEAASKGLPAHKAVQSVLSSFQGRLETGVEASQDGNPGTEEAMPVGGGFGSIPVSERPDLMLSASADISSGTPMHSVLSIGQHAAFTAVQDTNLLSQRHAAWAVKDGISLFTRGEAKDGQRAVQEVGMMLHAASGSASVQAQADAFTLTAQKSVDIHSTAAGVELSAPRKILLNGGGSYIQIDGGNIELATSGSASFSASLKELTGGGRTPSTLPDFPALRAFSVPSTAPSTIFGEALDHSAIPDAWLPFRFGASTTVLAGTKILGEGQRSLTERPTTAITTSQPTDISYWQRHEGPAWQLEETTDIATCAELLSSTDDLEENSDE